MPELRASDDLPDVAVRLGSVPPRIPELRASGAAFQVGPENYMLRVEGVGRYWSKTGSEIVVDPQPGAAWNDVRTFLLGPPLAALLLERALLVLHAAAVVGRRGAVLIAGHSGRGKSTILAALARQDHEVLTDDMSVVTTDSSAGLWVQPGAPYIKLWADSAARLGRRVEGLHRVRSSIEKYWLPVGSRFSAKPQPLGGIVVLEVANVDDVRVERLENAARFEAVRAQTRNPRVAEGLGVQSTLFRIIAKIAAAVPVIRVRRPQAVDSVNDIVEVLRRELL